MNNYEILYIEVRATTKSVLTEKFTELNKEG